jgi:hypothetical protein
MTSALLESVLQNLRYVTAQINATLVEVAMRILDSVNTHHLKMEQSVMMRMPAVKLQYVSAEYAQEATSETEPALHQTDAMMREFVMKSPDSAMQLLNLMEPHVLLEILVLLPLARAVYAQLKSTRSVLQFLNVTLLDFAILLKENVSMYHSLEALVMTPTAVL